MDNCARCATLLGVSTFVIVHGAFGGGWEWTPVAEILRRRGHVVFTPTLTGMGERVHLGPRAGLNTNILDVVALLDFEDLRDVVLCGASYGGMAVTGAADRVAEHARRRYTARLRPQPVATFTEPIHLLGLSASVPRAFIRCTESQLDIRGDPIEPMAHRARAAGWLFRELAAPHDPHLADPEGTAALLDEIGR